MVNIDFNKFKTITGYDIKSFFTRFYEFIENDYGNIISYYSGEDLVEDSFFRMESLLKDISIIEPLFRINANRFKTIDSWELLDLFSECQVKMMTVNKTGKWMKSSRLNKNEVGVKVDRIQRQNETLEMMASDLGFTNPNDDWTSIALNNQVIEEDYTPEGGKIITVVFQQNLNIGIDNIVDYMFGQNVLGKDIYRKITFENNDLKVLNFRDAINQSFEIKINVQKNSIPEFPNYGIDPTIIGSNVAAISYPSIFRDILTLFKQDKRWEKVELIDIFRKDDSIFMKFEASNILKDSLITNINI